MAWNVLLSIVLLGKNKLIAVRTYAPYIILSFNRALRVLIVRETLLTRPPTLAVFSYSRQGVRAENRAHVNTV